MADNRQNEKYQQTFYYFDDNHHNIDDSQLTTTLITPTDDDDTNVTTISSSIAAASNIPRLGTSISHDDDDDEKQQRRRRRRRRQQRLHENEVSGEGLVLPSLQISRRDEKENMFVTPKKKAVVVVVENPTMVTMEEEDKTTRKTIEEQATILGDDNNNATSSIMDGTTTMTTPRVVVDIDDTSVSSHDDHQRQRAAGVTDGTTEVDDVGNGSSEGGGSELPSIFPSDQDRKRIVGCLAGILASSYAYDVEDNNNTTHPNSTPDATHNDSHSYYHPDTSPPLHHSPPLQHPTSSSSPPPSSSSSPPKQQSQDPEILATNRHRRRRHEIYLTLLRSAAELLFLDECHARAFAPMLDKLRHPSPKNKTEATTGQQWEGIPSNPSPTSIRLPTPKKNSKTHIPSPRQCSAVSFLDNDSLSSTSSSSSSSPPTTPPLPTPPPSTTPTIPSTLPLDLLTPFLHTLTPPLSYRLIATLLLRYLLLSPTGYDSRVRHAFKKLAIVVLSNGKKPHFRESLSIFEALERETARLLIDLERKNDEVKKEEEGRVVRRRDESVYWRGLKIGSAGVVAGALLAITGGLAAPGIAAGVAAVAGSTAAATTTISTLTAPTTITILFGLSGGSLYAYKMKRRTAGLTDFTFQNESSSSSSRQQQQQQQPELSTTICLSGWLRDDCDFQRPWGVKCSNPPIPKSESLKLFYRIYKPENESRVERILRLWKGEERQLWRVLKCKYGRDPDGLWGDRERRRRGLTRDEVGFLEEALDCWGYRRRGSSRRRGRRVVEPPPPPPPPLPPSTASSHPWDFQSRYGGELYTIRWEVDLLLELCDSVTDFAVDLVGNATKEILKHTAMTTLIAAVALPVALINAANMLDETWSLAITRAEEAGVELAHCLMESQAGHRPVSLVGFSMGTRVIYSCLKELARLQEIWEDRRDEAGGGGGGGAADSSASASSSSSTATDREEPRLSREPAGIVEDVVIMGMPNHLSIPSWKSCRRIVAGRLINCYSKKDLVLSVMFQLKRMSAVLKPICGTSPVDVPGVENYDVTGLVQSHSDYCSVVEDILEVVNFGMPWGAKGGREGGCEGSGGDDDGLEGKGQGVIPEEILCEM